MKILIVGAGPAGLAVATLLKRSDPHREVTVLERSQDWLAGWGITLRANALSFLELDRRIEPRWLEGRTLWYRGRAEIDLAYPPGVGNTGIARTALLDALVRCATEAGARIVRGADGTSVIDSAIASHDLVVAADGAHSGLRKRFASVFEPTITPGNNRYAWLGAAKSFRRLTAMLDDRTTPLLAWGYEHAEGLSTFIVEASEPTIEAASLARLPADEVCRLIGGVFAEPLSGAKVLSTGEVRWSAFPKLTCRRLWHENVVLVGDAAHTTHFSQGYGTMFAFDDALVLCRAIDESANIPEALARYEDVQKPKIAELQASCGASMRWAEDLVSAAERRDEPTAQALIAMRWRNNPVSPAPLESFFPRKTV